MFDPKQMEEFHRRSGPFGDSMVKLIQELAPSHWPLFMLRLDVAFSPINGVRSIKHWLWNPLNDQEISDFPAALFETTTALHATHAEFHQPWTRCLVILRRQPPSGYDCSISFFNANPNLP